MRIKIRNINAFDTLDYQNVTPESPSVRQQLGPVDRDEANVEAEKGETVLLPDASFYTIGGKRHYNGGTPLNLPGNSFIFSDSKDQQITGPVLEIFNKNPDKKLTPADISKQYKLNDYIAKLQDKTADSYDFTTTELMLKNNLKKLNELAIIQEGQKGFPDGVPEVQIAQQGGLINNNPPGKRYDPWNRNAIGVRTSRKIFPSSPEPEPGPGVIQSIKDYFGGVYGRYRQFQDEADLRHRVYTLDMPKDTQPTGVFPFDRPLNGFPGVNRTTYMPERALDRFPTPSLDIPQYSFKPDTVELIMPPDTKPPVVSNREAPKAAPAATPQAYSAPETKITIGSNYKGTRSEQAGSAPAIPQAPTPGKPTSTNLNFNLGLNGLQSLDVGNTLFDLATIRRGTPTRYQNYGLEQAQAMSSAVMPMDYQPVINDATKAASSAYAANNALGTNSQVQAANNSTIYGQLLEAVSRIRGEEYNANAQLMNANQAQQAQLAAAAGEDRMRNAMQYDDRVEALQDNFQKERTYLKNLALSRVNQYLSQNQAMLYDNLLHPQFTFDPTQGFAGTASFNPRSNPFSWNSSGAPAQGNQLDTIYRQLQQMGLDPKEARDQAARIYARSRYPDTEAPTTTR